jgi:urate oxidase
MGIVLGANQYGKAETRLVRVDRDGKRHALRDLNVSVALRGDLERTHLTGDNATVLPTDSMKNTVYAFAGRYGVGQIEEFGLRLARHFVDSQPSIDAARIGIEEYGWTRLGPHSFARDAGETRTAVLTYDGNTASAVGGLQGLVLLNSTDSEFWGYLKDAYTTLPETRDRILATEVAAYWRFGAPSGDWADSNAGVRAALIEAFVDTYSLSLQQTLYQMGYRVLAKRPEIAEVRLSLPNKHHLLVDLAPFGLDNPNEVFVAADRPYGLIEGTVLRDDAPPAGLAWW